MKKIFLIVLVLASLGLGVRPHFKNIRNRK